MENELIIPQVPIDTEDKLLEGLISSDFTPILTLCQGLSKSVVEGKCTPGEFAFYGHKKPCSKLTGKPPSEGKATVKVVPLTWRPAARLIHNESKESESYDTKSDVFATIQRKAKEPKVKGFDYRVGPEWLLYLVDLGIVATYHFCKTAKGNSFAISDKGQEFLLTSVMIKNRQFSWYVPQPIATGNTFKPQDLTEDQKKIIQEEAKIFVDQATGGSGTKELSDDEVGTSGNQQTFER